jgi:hypothetical protein
MFTHTRFVSTVYVTLIVVSWPDVVSVWPVLVKTYFDGHPAAP